MGAPSLLWNEEAAYAALRQWLLAIYGPGGLATTLDARPPPALAAERVYRARQDAPSFAGGSITLIATTQTPVSRSPIGDVITAAQVQRWLVDVTSVADGEAFALAVLGATTPAYVASVPPDDADAVRDQLVADVAGLGVAATASATATSGQLQVLADVPGAHLAVAVDQGSMTATIADDAARRRTRRPSTWTVRFTFEDVKPAGVGAPSWARRRAELLETFLDAGDDVPLVAGDPGQYLSDVLYTAKLGYTRVVSRIDGDYARNQAVWVDVSAVDVEFSTTAGLDRDVITLEAVGVQGVSVTE